MTILYKTAYVCRLFTKEEERFIVKYHKHLTAKELAESLKRTEDGVKAKIKYMRRTSKRFKTQLKAKKAGPSKGRKYGNCQEFVG